MFATSIIEVAIGLVFIYLLLSLMCSAANEIIESFLKNRATDLERGIRELFNQEGGSGLVAAFYTHPLINGLFPGKYDRHDSQAIGFKDFLKSTNLPSYIPARNFAYSIIDIVLHPPTNLADSNVRDDAQGGGPQTTAVNAAVLPVSMDAIRSAIRSNFGNSQSGRALRTLAEQAGADVNAFRQNVETWFNGSMDRVSGAYKRRTQWIIFVIGLVLTVLLNVNTITIARSLSADASLRSMIVAQAERTSSTGQPTADFEKNKAELQSLGLPLGWKTGIDFIHPLRNPKFNLWDHILLPLLGWLLTAAAISLGAPFWFDLLNKFMVIRATVKPHEKSLEEGSEDRQTKGGVTVSASGASPVSPVPAVALAAGPAAPAAATGFFSAVPEPKFDAEPDDEDNESHIDEGDDPIKDLTPDEELPPTTGGVG